ncbi:sugar kinase [Leptospira gomenensis]|uniref:Sugar kinase n=1 Tax=Leptospira gomenensis TaxID=2484974 RepID=A0A5F1YZN8_9LEPT|nr:sugar kinase [Leptospira gomenensis]TGK31110.1 sugar kinase [Leptospira gomenensis]TGK43314.1 sugar kinase [Leptospira gomenensis]TGK45171.1 sugar kinase [Leptospira gomenensis]TGK66085.1 sugar kinase [Leptospira gomenensis]
MRITYYVSGHGFGHISRSAEIVFHLLRGYPDLEIELVTTRGEFLRTLSFNPEDTSLTERLKVRDKSVDVGMIQKDSLSIDVRSTEFALEEFNIQKSYIQISEIEACLDFETELVISDAASLPFTVADKIKVPSLFVGNFTWDFIYAGYSDVSPVFARAAEIFYAEYYQATFGLLLPFDCPADSLPERKKIGLVGRRPTLDKRSAQKRFELSDDRINLLFSFGAYGLKEAPFHWNSLDPQRYRIVLSGTNINLDEIPERLRSSVCTFSGIHYPDLVAACDYVITKPGYGILSEAVYAETPVLYTDRGNFPEVPYLIKALEEEIPSAYLSNEELFAFRFEPAIGRVRSWKGKPSPLFKRDGREDVKHAVGVFLRLIQ